MASAGDRTVSAISILAEFPLIEYADGTQHEIRKNWGVLLARLALAPNGIVKIDQDLAPLMDSPHSMVSKGLSLLGRLGVPTSKHDHRYRLDIDLDLFDVRRFMSMVAGFADGTASLVELDDALAMWRGDPRAAHPRIPGPPWQALFRRRDELVRLLTSRSQDELARLRHLDTFLGIFSGDSAVDRVSHLLNRKRVLIVDDADGADLERSLSEYACDIVPGWPDWQARIQANEAFPHDIALVDLHLQPELNDYLGGEVLTDLRRLGIPAILMSAGVPPAGVMTRNKEEMGFAEYYCKRRPYRDLASSIGAVLSSRAVAGQ